METTILSESAREKHEAIKYLYHHPDCPKRRIAVRFRCSLRTVNRWLFQFAKEIAEGRSGEAVFIHGNTARKPACAIPEEIKDSVFNLYTTKYEGANFTHFTELLEKHEGIELSVSSCRNILEERNIFSPHMTKAKKKRIKKVLRESLNVAKSVREKREIQNNLVALENAHSRRPRVKYFGELIQMDASSFEWIPGQIWHLHAAIDDATNTIVGLWFDWQETLSGYYHVLSQILSNYGIPARFLTDNRTVFMFKRRNEKSIEKDTQTQFGYACMRLGIELNTTSVPQAKGRIERLNKTLQDRLPIELRLAGISDIESANQFLATYMEMHNSKFAIQLGACESVFAPAPSAEEQNLALAVLTPRTVDQGHSIKFNKQYFRMVDKDGEQVHYAKGTKVLVIQAFDQNMYCSANDKYVFALEVIPQHEKYSKEFDSPLPEEKKKRYIPAMSHPWKQASFQAYLRTRAYLEKETEGY